MAEASAVAPLRPAAPISGRGVRDHGPAPDGTPSHLMLMLKRSPEQEQALDRLIHDQGQPGIALISTNG